MKKDEILKELERLKDKEAREKQKRSEYNATARSKVDHFGIVLPKGTKDRIKKAASEKGYKSVNAFLSNLVLTSLDAIEKTE